MKAAITIRNLILCWLYLGIGLLWGCTRSDHLVQVAEDTTMQDGIAKYTFQQDPELVRRVTKEGATEAAFTNAYWDNQYSGLYVDPYTGVALFASMHKYKSGSGWPSFYKAINPMEIELKDDSRFSMKRTEVRSLSSDSHVGHVFDDGPLPTGKRYCMNSAALQFLAQESLQEPVELAGEKQDYRDYLALFAENPQEATQQNSTFASAIFAGGCFWCSESAFEGIPGVMKVLSGYTGGREEDASYEKISQGNTGHYEAVLILYRKDTVDYQTLLDIFWRHIDPTDAGGQFYDRGSQYHTAVFYRSEAEQQLAEQSKAQLQNQKTFGDATIVTAILPESSFYLAEAQHQDYSIKNVQAYQNYVRGSGRKLFLQAVWEEQVSK